MFEAAALPVAELDTRADAQGRPIGRHAGGWGVPMYAPAPGLDAATVGYAPRLNKPPLVYWLQVASAWTLTLGDPARDAIWMYRLPSALAALLSVLLTWRLGLRMFDARAAWLAGALLAVAPMFVWDAHQARADQLMTLCVLATQFALWRVWSSHDASGTPPGRTTRRGLALSWLWPLAFWAALGASALAKGPIGPMVTLLCVVALCVVAGRWRWLRALRPIVGVGVLAVVVLPWVWAVVGTFGLARTWSILWDEVFVRAATGAREGHFAPPGTHLVLLTALFWPGSLLTLAGLARAVRLGLPRQRAATSAAPTRVPWYRRAVGRAPELFLLAWIVPAWVVFELSLAKLPHYTMPLFPAIALLSARAVLAATGRAKASTIGTWIWALVGWVPAVGLIALGCSLVIWGDRSLASVTGAAVLILAGTVASACIALGVQALRSSRFALAQGAGIVATVLVLAPALHLAAPALVPGAHSAEIIDRARTLDSWASRPVASAYHEDSLVFQTRGRVLRASPDQLEAFVRAHPDGWAVLRAPPKDEPALPTGWRVVEPARGPVARKWLVVAGPEAPAVRQPRPAKEAAP